MASAAATFPDTLDVLTTCEPEGLPKKSADALKDVKITDAEILQYEPLIKKHINEQVLRFWAKGHTVQTLDPEVSIGRLGLSVNDLMQYGRMHVMNQLRYLKVNHDPKRSKHLTMLYTYLRNKFQSLSRVNTNGKHGGGIVAMDEQRAILQALVERIHAAPEMSLEEAEALLATTSLTLNREIQRQIRVGLYIKGKFNVKMKTALDIARHVEGRMVHMEVVHVMSFDDVRQGNADSWGGGGTEHSNFEGVDYETPESLLLSKQFLENEIMTDENNNNEPVAATTEPAAAPEAVVVVDTTVGNTEGAPKKRRKTRNSKSGNFLIFKLAKEKGLPDRHADLAALLGKKPAAFSMIIHNHSKGNEAFLAKLAEVFPGYTLDQLRSPVEAEKPTEPTPST